jgi:hypothetical protein
MHNPEQFSVRALLTLVTVIAMLAAFAIQNRRHAATRAALSRYESEQVAVSLPPGSFRIFTYRHINTDHVKVLTYRIECGDAFFGKVAHSHGASSQSLRYDANVGTYFAEWTYVFDYLPTENKLKVSDMGYTLLTVPDGYSLSTELELHNVDGVHETDATVELFILNGKPYSLSLK